MATIPGTLNTNLTDEQVLEAFDNALTHTPSDSTPKEDGSGSAGEAETFARSDHEHPHDTTKQDTLAFEGTYNASTNKVTTMSAVKDGKLAGYAQTSGNVTATDKIIEAIGKVEKKADDNKTNILLSADQSVRYNILPHNLEETKTNNRITVTANGDGTVTVTTDSAGASANTFFGIGNVYLNAGDYYLLGGVSNLLRLQDNTDTYFDSGSGVLMHITTAANYTIYLRVNSGYTNTSGVVVKPRIIPKSTYDAGFTDYQPYAMSNVELTAAIQAIQAQLANQ